VRRKPENSPERGSGGRVPGGNDDEAKFLASYRPEDYPRPAVTVDIVVLTIVDAELRVLLVKRNEHPFKGKWALPGGFVRVGDARKDQGEDIDAAAERELAEETGLPRGSAFLEQLRAFGKPGRDPRMRVISVAYFALVRPTLAPFVQAGGDASHAQWVGVERIKKDMLAFDHDDILSTALARTKADLEGSRIAFELVPETFTIPELRNVHSIIKGAPQDPGNFRKRFNRMLEEGVIEVAPGKRITTSKPAKVYRFTQR
jgi:8-oxo-dGTP diphosphatase